MNIAGELNFYKFSDGTPQWKTFYAQDLGVFNSKGEVDETATLKIVELKMKVDDVVNPTKHLNNKLTTIDKVNLL